MLGGMLKKMRSPFFKKEEPEQFLPEENIDALREVSEKGDSIERMTQSMGWRILAEDMSNRFEMLTKELRQADLKDVPQLQAKLNELEWISLYAALTVEAGKEASNRLREALAASKESQ